MPDFTLVITPPAVLAVVVTPPVVLTSALTVGQGPSGPPGAGSGISRTSSIAIGGSRLVASVAGDIVYADNTLSAHLGKLVGLTAGAASAGNPITIASAGEIIEPSWTWTADQPVYLGTNGLLTQTVPVRPTANFLQRVGFAVAPTRLFLSIDPPIVL